MTVKSVSILVFCLLANIAWPQPDDPDRSPPHDSFWNGFEEGCIQRNILSDIFWLDFPFDLSLASIAFGYWPDTGKGPAFFARLDSGETGAFSDNREKNVFLAWALGHKTCIVKTDFEQCASANDAFDLLKKLKIPINNRFDKPYGMPVFHATEYYLFVNDGAGNFNKWNMESGNNPMVEAVYSAGNLLKQCSQQAYDALTVREDAQATTHE